MESEKEGRFFFSRHTHALRALQNRFWDSLRSRRLEVVGTRKNGRARRRVLSFARYFPAPATQANFEKKNPDCFAM